MMADDQASTWLLKSESSDDISDIESPLKAPRKRRRYFNCTSCYPHFIPAAAMITFLILNNLVWYIVFTQYPRSEASLRKIDTSRKNLTYYLEDNEGEKMDVPYEHDWTRLEEIEVNGYRYADVHWTPGLWAPEHGGVVSIPRKFQEEYNLDPRAAVDPEDSSKVFYLVSGFHELHCLHVVRDTIYYLNGTIEWPTPPFQWSHILHCLEAVRQSVTCNLDPTLIPLDTVWPGIPNGQVHECRNFDPLYEWALLYGHTFPPTTAILEGPHSNEWLERMALQDSLNST